MWVNLFLSRSQKSVMAHSRLIGLFTWKLLLYCWFLSRCSLLRRKWLTLVKRLVKIVWRKATFSHTRWSLFRPTQTCEIPSHMVGKSVPWSQVLNTVFSRLKGSFYRIWIITSFFSWNRLEARTFRCFSHIALVCDWGSKDSLNFFIDEWVDVSSNEPTVFW